VAEFRTDKKQEISSGSVILATATDPRLQKRGVSRTVDTRLEGTVWKNRMARTLGTRKKKGWREQKPRRQDLGIGECEEIIASESLGCTWTCKGPQRLRSLSLGNSRHIREGMCKECRERTTPGEGQTGLQRSRVLGPQAEDLN